MSLPPLPEPVAWRCTQRVPDDGARFSCVSDNHKFVQAYPGHNWHDLFTSDHLRAAQREMAEECARLCEGDGMLDLAQEIRSKFCK